MLKRAVVYASPRTAVIDAYRDTPSARRPAALLVRLALTHEPLAAG
jgi:hypothetical protein